MCWFDATFAILMEAPQAELEKMHDHLVRESARISPDRETWGLLPEHQAMQQRAMNTGNTPTTPGRKRGDGRTM